jgi:aminoglycoside phosphotransferase (APT) family kinase protein
MSESAVRDWVSSVVPGVREVRPLDGSGLSREMWVGTGDGPDVIVKRDTGRGPLSGTMFTPGREAAGIRAAVGVARPTVLAVSDDGSMFAMTRLAGSIDDEADRSLRDSLVSNVTALHQLDPGTLGMGEQPSTVHAAVLANIAAFRDAYEGLSSSESVVDDAYALAVERVPGDDRAPVFLHGDLGPGNVLYADGAVTGLLDWEMWHLGDPMDDLASLWFRKCVLRRDTDLDEWLKAYSVASGREVDDQTLGYYRMLTMLRVVTAVLVMQEKDPDRNEAVAAQMLPLLDRLVRGAA